MDSIYEKLYGSYGESILQELDCAYDEEEIFAQLECLPLEPKTRLRLEELFFEYHYRWSLDAFTLGLHQGLSLLHNDVRRGRPQ